MENRKIFRIDAESAAMAVVTEYLAAVTERDTKTREFFEEANIHQARGHNGVMEQVAYQEGTEPKELRGVPFEKLFRKKASPGVYRTDDALAWYELNKRSKAGKDLAVELGMLGFVSERCYARHLFNGDTQPYDGRFVYYPGFQMIGDDVFVHVHKKAKCTTVKGLAEIPLSEYYRIKEEYEKLNGVEKPEGEEDEKKY